MKVRWMPESLRMRITPSELEMLLDGQAVAQRIFRSSGWGIEVKPSQETELILEGEVVTVKLSHADIKRLGEPSREGIYFNSAHEPSIRYFVEKDFPCAHERPPETGEPETETFSAPEGFKARHRQP
ncbi:MAG: hypothetical protein JSS72_07905 [Armatimonadetes bacterium]|nr:hypothetical protein [Armatimonadota bacterium]